MRRAALAMLLAAALAGCGMIAPYPTAPLPREAKAPPDAGPRVAICYNTLHTALNEVQASAQAECPSATIATPIGTDYYLQNCPLLLPARATFACAAQK